MDLTFYTTTDLEEFINIKYKENGIYYPSDMDIDAIASLFCAMIETHVDKTKVLWDGDFALIRLNVLQSKEEQREESFHEIGHIVRHIGDQCHLPKLFTDFQESQANLFLMYAAMPIYMLEEYKEIPSFNLIKTIAKDFTLTEKLVRRRLQQIENRIYWGKLDHERRKAFKVPSEKVSPDHLKQIIEEFVRKRNHREEREREGYYAAENYS